MRNPLNVSLPAENFRWLQHTSKKNGGVFNATPIVVYYTPRQHCINPQHYNIFKYIMQGTFQPELYQGKICVLI